MPVDELEILIAVKDGKGGRGDRLVKALRTPSPFIVINPTCFAVHDAASEAGFWSVTHLPTGYAYAHLAPNQDTAMRLAAWFAALPLRHDGSFEEIKESRTPETRQRIAAIDDALRHACEWLLEAHCLMDEE